MDITFSQVKGERGGEGQCGATDSSGAALRQAQGPKQGRGTDQRLVHREFIYREVRKVTQSFLWLRRPNRAVHHKIKLEMSDQGGVD